MVLDIAEELATEFNLNIGQVKGTVELLDKGNTIPFIARYRKETTGKLAEDMLRKLSKRLDYLRKLEQEKEKVINAIDKQGKLTSKLQKEISAATSLQEVKDLYRPYKQKKKTKAARAKEKGLEPLAKLFLEQEIKKGSIKQICADFIDSDKGLEDAGDVLEGVKDIIIQYVTDQPESRQLAREVTFKKGQLTVDSRMDEVTKYQNYYDFVEKIKKLAPYQTLAINRGEDEEILKVKVIASDDEIINKLEKEFITTDSIFKPILKETIQDAYYKRLAPAIAREVRSQLTEKAEEHAINVFTENLKNLLMQPPLLDKRILAIDPAFRTGCKVAVLNELGELLTTDVIYPHAPQKNWEDAKESLNTLIEEYKMDVVTIGNGTACRETEELIAEIISESTPDLRYIIVNEDGASVYSASSLAQEEFPNLDVSLRGAISIGRRLQDPLAELVKIAPKHLGVGLYQHDLNQINLEEALEEVVESVVNYVGVDLNTASSALLEYVAGINSSVAENIVEYRREQGKFSSREELTDVYGVGPSRFKQAAGFLRIKDGANPLDQTAIHPESYQTTKKLLSEVGFTIKDLLVDEMRVELQQQIEEIDLTQFVTNLEVGLPTLEDIKRAVLKPDRDPRDSIPIPIFKQNILKIDDLEVGMILQGKIRNVVDFGAFVDIGVKEDGLVHISELSSNYIDNPLEVVTVGQPVKVKILDIDSKQSRISLTMDF